MVLNGLWNSNQQNKWYIRKSLEGSDPSPQNVLMIYKIEAKIQTLAKAALMRNQNNIATFSISKVKFSHWDFNIRDGWLSDAWIAETTIKAPNYISAFKKFRLKLKTIIPKISLISQCYIEYNSHPFLISKKNSNIVFFQYTDETPAVGLMFMEKEEEALKILLKTKNIPNEFYFYWNDAVNTTGYTPKLLLMFCALEALGKTNGKKNFEKICSILGQELYDDIFTQNNGLRHRLTHGEYFNEPDTKKDYFELIHKKIIQYFNKTIFQKDLLNDTIVQPQRHPFGNKRIGKFFLQSSNLEVPMDLKSILLEFNKNGIYNIKKYKYFFDKNITKQF